MAAPIPPLEDADREALRSTAREVLDRHSASADVHRRVDAERSDADGALWDLMVDLGWPGVAVPEELGGVGYGVEGLIVLVQELGGRLTGTSLVPSAVAVSGLLLAPASRRRDALVREIALGQRRVAVVLESFVGSTGTDGMSLVADGDGWRLHGSAGLVWGAGTADDLLVVCRTDDRAVVVCLSTSTPGIVVEGAETIDRTRQLDHVRFEDVSVPAASVLDEGVRSIAEGLVDTMAMALAADSIGGAQQALDITTAYVGQRVQFGRPIGSFQAVKHACADMFVAVEASRSAVATVVRGLSVANGDASSVAASTAKAYCADAYTKVAGQAVQLHGGIGFTWEGDAQLHLKRALLNQQLGGSGTWHRRRAAELLFDRSAA